MTIKEHFSKAIADGYYWAPEAYKEALKVNNLNDEAESLSEALIIAFRWDKTEMGIDYWATIYTNEFED